MYQKQCAMHTLYDCFVNEILYHTNLFAQYPKLHKFATTNSNFEKKNSFRHASS